MCVLLFKINVRIRFNVKYLQVVYLLWSTLYTIFVCDVILKTLYAMAFIFRIFPGSF
jgi:hypothetical protein